MSRKNKYLDDLGIPRENYGGNFVHERKLLRFRQRRCYGFDYRDVFNMDSSFAEWLYSHMRMYRDNSVHDDTMNTVAFEGREYTIAEAVDLIIEKTGEFLKIYHYTDVATVYKGNIIKNLIMDCQSYTKYRPNETTGGIFVSWRRKEELPTGA